MVTLIISPCSLKKNCIAAKIMPPPVLLLLHWYPQAVKVDFCIIIQEGTQYADFNNSLACQLTICPGYVLLFGLHSDKELLTIIIFLLKSRNVAFFSQKKWEWHTDNKVRNFMSKIASFDGTSWFVVFFFSGRGRGGLRVSNPRMASSLCKGSRVLI